MQKINDNQVGGSIDSSASFDKSHRVNLDNSIKRGPPGGKNFDLYILN